MTSMIITAWLTSGLTLWFAMLGDITLPDRWISQDSRQHGWADVLLVNFPLSLAVGPIGWLIFLYARLKP